MTKPSSSTIHDKAYMYFSHIDRDIRCKLSFFVQYINIYIYKTITIPKKVQLLNFSSARCHSLRVFLFVFFLFFFLIISSLHLQVMSAFFTI